MGRIAKAVSTILEYGDTLLEINTGRFLSIRPSLAKLLLAAVLRACRCVYVYVCRGSLEKSKMETRGTTGRRDTI